MGELAALSASAVWAIASVLFAKLGADRISPLAMNFLKCSIACSLLWLTMLVLEGSIWPSTLSAPQLLALFASGWIGLTLGDTAFFGALGRLGPRRTLLFGTLGPPATALMAWPVLNEPMTPAMLLGMGLTLGGIVWVILERAPGDHSKNSEKTKQNQTLTRDEHIGMALATLSVLCQATGNILTKLGGEEVSSLAISVVRLSAGVMGLGMVLGLTRRHKDLLAPFASWRRTRLLLGGTLLGTYLGIWLLVTGLQHTSAGVASTLSSMSPIFILPIAALFLGERLSWRSVGGACLAVAGVAMLFLR